MLGLFVESVGEGGGYLLGGGLEFQAGGQFRGHFVEFVGRR